MQNLWQRDMMMANFYLSNKTRRSIYRVEMELIAFEFFRIIILSALSNSECVRCFSLGPALYRLRKNETVFIGRRYQLVKLPDWPKLSPGGVINPRLRMITTAATFAVNNFIINMTTRKNIRLTRIVNEFYWKIYPCIARTFFITIYYSQN